MGYMKLPNRKFYLPDLYYILRVEMVACGFSHNDRIIGQIVVVDKNERLIYQSFIKPQTTVLFYLKKLTGLSKVSSSMYMKFYKLNPVLFYKNI